MSVRCLKVGQVLTVLKTKKTKNKNPKTNQKAHTTWGKMSFTLLLKTTL